MVLLHKSSFVRRLCSQSESPVHQDLVSSMLSSWHRDAGSTVGWVFVKFGDEWTYLKNSGRVSRWAKHESWSREAKAMDDVGVVGGGKWQVDLFVNLPRPCQEMCGSPWCHAKHLSVVGSCANEDTLVSFGKPCFNRCLRMIGHSWDHHE